MANADIDNAIFSQNDLQPDINVHKIYNYWAFSNKKNAP